VTGSDEIEEQRERLLDGWDVAAKGWGRQADRTHETALPISEWMLEHTSPVPGETVLELAAGPGDTGFMAAARVAPDGRLICSDGSNEMLDVARERAAEQGLSNVEFKQLQLEWIDMDTASVDVILCRWGVMLTLDPASALRECRRVLRPGGRLAIAVWDLPATNPWSTIFQAALQELGHVQPAPDAGPGMFALSAPGLLADMLGDAGFLDVTVESVPILPRYTGVVDWVGETRDRSRYFSGVWAQLDDQQRRELRELLAVRAVAYTGPDGSLAMPGSSLAAAASA
jgi:SAM-dependent methyltransferase